MKSTYQTEMEILICCARAQLTTEDAQRLQTLLAQPIHWEVLQQLARYHKLIPLLFHHLARQAAGTIPPDWMAQLRDAAHGHVVWNYHQLDNLRQLTERLEAHGIPVLPYKGVALSQRLYGGLELRHTGDLDIIVPPADYWRAKALLEADGIAALEAMSPAEENEFVREWSELKMLSEEKNLVLELHWGVSPRYFSFPFAEMKVWKRTQWREVNGCRFRALNDEDTLILLCVHGALHAWSTLKWISDIAELLRTPCNIDWEQTLIRARALRSERMLLVGLWLAHELLGAPLPDRVRLRAAQDRIAKHLTATVMARIRRGAKQRTALPMMSFHLLVREHWQDRCCYANVLRQSVQQNWERARGDANTSTQSNLLRPLRLLKLYANIGLREWRDHKSALIARPNAA